METSINIDTLRQTVSTVNTITPLLIGAITGLFAVVTAMALYIVKQQKLITNLTRDTTIAINNNTNSNTHLVGAINDLKVVVLNRKK